MTNNESFRQSSTRATLTWIEDDVFLAKIMLANINGITCNITAEFAHQLAAEIWLESFGIYGWNFTVLKD